MATYVTAAELVGETIREEQVVAVLAGLSAHDCLGTIGALSARLHTARRRFDPSFQKGLVSSVAGETELADMVAAALMSSEHRRVAIFEQQLVHLARLVVLHAELRPADDFAGGVDRGDFLIALFGVTDVLDADLQIENESERLSWAVRQASINYGEESIARWGLYYDLLIRLWPQVPASESFAVEDAFQRYAGMSLVDHFTFAIGAYGRFSAFAQDPDQGLVIEPKSWFSSTKVKEAEWRPYFERSSRTVEQLRQALIAEERRYGRTTYGCQTFVETPLLDLGGDRYIPINMNAFERAATEGIFFLLADGAQGEGLAREAFTSPFGGVFEQSVVRTFERLAPGGSVGERVHGDFEYGTKHRRVRSSDVVLDYGNDLVFVESVAGQLRVATRTRGDLTSLRQDMRKLVDEKARQLDRCIRDFRSGALEVPNFFGDRKATIWPVIVTSASFPYTPPVAEAIAAQLKRDGCLRGRGIGPLALISAEELAAAEGLCEKGASFRDLIRGWQKHPSARLQSFKNYMIGIASEVGAAPPSSYHLAAFSEAMDRMSAQLFDRRR